MKNKLKLFTSKFWNVSVSKINDNFKFDDENLKDLSSIRFFQFIIAIESNFDVKVKNINKIITFKDLVNKPAVKFTAGMGFFTVWLLYRVNLNTHGF
jgi:acyl carrier protein